MASGRISSEALVQGYLDRIERYDRRGPAVHAVRCLAPDALDQAKARDDDRAARRRTRPAARHPGAGQGQHRRRGPAHDSGIARARALDPQRDAALVTRLREAGAVILGKANLTEFANFMAEDMPSGYSSLGGQVLNPYDVEPDAVRVEQRLWCGGGPRLRDGGRRQRDRRVDPVPVRRAEPCRGQADAGPGQRRGHPADRVEPGLCRPDDPHGVRRRRPAGCVDR